MPPKVSQPSQCDLTTRPVPEICWLFLFFLLFSCRAYCLCDGATDTAYQWVNRTVGTNYWDWEGDGYFYTETTIIIIVKRKGKHWTTPNILGDNFEPHIASQHELRTDAVTRNQSNQSHQSNQSNQSTNLITEWTNWQAKANKKKKSTTPKT